MQTSNFAISGKHPNAVAISIGVPRGWRGKRYLPLAPTRAMLKMNEADYVRHYQAILDRLDPRRVYEELLLLTAPKSADPILLCWEGFNGRCHRRWVAEWLEKALGVVIPEVGHDRSESIPFAEQKRAHKSAKTKSPKQLSLA